LGLEFNHCEQMERASRRPRFLVERVLGDFGHLSNAQAADAVRRFAEVGELQAVVQLHLSRDCNTAELANEAGRAAVVGTNTTVVTATQWHPTPSLPLTARSPKPARPITRTPPPRRSVQLSLPGLEPDAA